MCVSIALRQVVGTESLSEYRTGIPDTNMVFASYGKNWRDRRRIVDRHFRPSSVVAYQHIQEEKVAIAMKEMADTPENFIEHMKQYTTAITFSVVYGYDVRSKQDHFVDIAEEYNVLTQQCVTPGALIVNTFPIRASHPRAFVARVLLGMRKWEDSPPGHSDPST